MQKLHNPDEFDRACLDLATEQARQSFDGGNFPVGAVLASEGQVIDSGGNTGETSGNYANHAETSLILKHGGMLLDNVNSGADSTIYSTLEPCLMCLGVAVINRVTRIIYIQDDPNAGACSLDPAILTPRYRDEWPEILHAPYSDEPGLLIVKSLRRQIEAGAFAGRRQKCLGLFEAQVPNLDS